MFSLPRTLQFGGFGYDGEFPIENFNFDRVEHIKMALAEDLASNVILTSVLSRSRNLKTLEYSSVEYHLDYTLAVSQFAELLRHRIQLLRRL